MSQKQQLEALAFKVPCGELQVLIWGHTIPAPGSPIECWTYLSQGMHKVNQPELVITLRKRPSELSHEYSHEPFQWFKMVYSWGKKDRIIDAYHTHEAHFEHFFGSKYLETLTYGMPVDVPGIAPALPQNRLHGIVLTKKEANLAKVFGYTRVVGHYGLTEKWFPYCPWIDRDRGECVTIEQMKGGLRGKEVPVKKIRALTARWEGNRIILTIPLGREVEVQAAVRQTGPEDVWGLDSALDQDAGSCFYWESGQKEMRVYGGCDGERVQYCKGLAFLMFCPQQPNDHWNLMEDGINLFLRNSTWLSIREALTSQKDIQVPLSNDMTFCVDFIRDTFKDASTGLDLSLQGGEFRNYHPRNPKWLKGSHVRFEKMISSTNWGHTAASFPEIGNYIERIGEALAARIPKKDHGAGKKIIIPVIQLSTDNIENWLTLSFSPGPEGIDAAGLVDMMLKLPKPLVDAYVKLQMIISVWG